MKIFVPPLKCQGIKTKLVPWIQDSVSLTSDTIWHEPFMGSGVVGFNVRPRRAVFSDTNPHIIRFYQALQERSITPGIAQQFLEEEGARLSEHGQAHYYAVRERFNTTQNPLDFLFLNRSCFNGIMRFNRKGAYNVPFGHKPERFAKAYITKIVNQIDYVAKCCVEYDWRFVCQDFRTALAQTAFAQTNSTSLIYCDPPYIGRHTDYYDSWSEADEQELFILLCSTPASFLLSTWHSTKWRTNTALEKYAAQFTVAFREHFYHVGASENNRNAVVEALVGNCLKPRQNLVSAMAKTEAKTENFEAQHVLDFA
ncbi:MAG: Dam family site-specific DNA-(adenine-N6)-methyltransferase [Candidatus Kapaibacterium sp.]|nr:MAG: Dam family site-specific DNA-(adenine-N6)-methyltransferase [Candidatus Kapabacteria bacterium]